MMVHKFRDFSALYKENSVGFSSNNVDLSCFNNENGGKDFETPQRRYAFLRFNSKSTLKCEIKIKDTKFDRLNKTDY